MQQSTPPRTLCVPDDDLVAFVMEVYERGQTVDALRRAEAFAPLKQWNGVLPCVLAARIAANAGAPGLSTKLTLRAWKLGPHHPDALAQYSYEIFSRRGPLALWQVLRQWQEDQSTSGAQRAEIFALKSRAASHLRDFAAAENLLKRAESFEPVKPWIRLQRAHLLENQDRLEEAIEAAKSARDLHGNPFYRPAVQTQAHLLQLLNRDEDAIQLLRDADAVLQNGPVAAQLYGLLSENGRWREADAALQRYEDLSPLVEPPVEKWLTAQRARAAYHLGRRADAARIASELEDHFHKEFSGKVCQPQPALERVQLEVTFVRQHFKTCAPATLAAIGHYWKMPAEHLKLAEAICYDGTPHWQQREWAERNGWHVREFRVTHEAAITLTERAIPFAISTVEATSAHMMAVIGFDRTRSTLLLRDPGQPYVVEVAAEEFLKRYRASGPHGTVFVPANERVRLEGLHLPDAELYDEYHAFWMALGKHDRNAAASAQERLAKAFPEAPLTWEARLDLAAYDANTTEQVRCLDKLLEFFPGNPARLLRRLECLYDAPRSERVRFLESACAGKEADPALFIALARTLQGDARTINVARRWLKRAMRWRPMDSSAISVLADLLWDDGKFEEATELYWFAANIEGFRENLYQTWFVACRRTRRTEMALTHLQERFARFGSRSEQPALTLAWAWREMDQPAKAHEVLNEGLRLRPKDGYLSLHAASLLAGVGEHAESEKLLVRAKPNVRENDWLRASAEIAENRLDLDAVLQHSRELLGREPLALDAHGRIARVLSRREGNAAARAHLASACAEHPHHYGLRRMLVDWSRDAGPAEVEAAARKLLELEPGDAWAHRERALVLASLKRGDEALHEAAEAARIEPRNSYSFSVLGHIHRQFAQLTPARAQFRRAVELSVDNSDAITALLELARTDRERKEELAFVEAELIRQVVAGDGLLAFLDLAGPILEPETLLCTLRRAHSERPDLWHAWSALANQFGHMGRLDDALSIAKEASTRFPHLPRIWLDLAKIHQWRHDADQEIAAAERAFEMNPSWGRATATLSSALERRGRLNDARDVCERALRHAPRDPQLYALYANVLWRQQQIGPAFDAIEQALRLAPGYEWAWDLLWDWSSQTGQGDRPANFARSLSRDRAGEMRVWMMLARVLTQRDAADERLAAVNRALELEQHSTEAWDLKAQFLTEAEHFDEAIEACERGTAACQTDIYVLQGRRAWIEARRRQLADAVRLMREVLAENSSYVWGWHQLAVWLGEKGLFAEATSAFEQLQRLRPHDAWVNCQLGLARLKQDDKPGAEHAFKMALDAAPTDSAAAHNLFDLQLNAGDLVAAASTLRVMQMHQPGAGTLAAEIVLHLRDGEHVTAAALLKTLCVSPDPATWPIDTASDAFARAGQSRKALKILRRALKGDACNSQVAAAAVRLLLARQDNLAATWLFLRQKPGEMERRAAALLVNGLANHKSELLLRFLLWRRRAVLFRDDQSWGQVGYALITFNRMKPVARWLADWRDRPNVQPWMLFNLCLALRHMGQYGEATTVARHVVQTWGHREGSADMRLFLAIEEALAGSPATAAEHLEHVVPRENVRYDEQILALTKALVDFRKTPQPDRRAALKAVRRQLAKHFGTWRLLHSMRDVRRTFARTGDVFHRNGAGFGSWLWFKWKLHWQWSFLPLAPLALAVALQPPILLGLLIWRLSRRRG